MTKIFTSCLSFCSLLLLLSSAPKSTSPILQDCSDSRDCIAASPSCDLRVNVYSTGETCKGAKDGTVRVTVIGAVAPYNFEWSHGSSTLDLTGLSPGVYGLTVTDAADCIQDVLVFIAAGLPRPTLSAGNGTNLCGDECYRLPLTFGGDGPFVLRYLLTQGTEQTVYEESFIDNETGLDICPVSLGITASSFTIEFLEVSGRRCSDNLNIIRNFGYYPVAEASISPVLCDGASLEIANTVFNAANPNGSVLLPEAGANGCDSLIHVNASFLPSSERLLTPSLCAGEGVLVEGELFDQARPNGTVVLPGGAATGCDSIIRVALDFYPEATGSLGLQLCPGDSVLIAGEMFNEARPKGSIRFPGASTSGCDSVLNVFVSFLSSEGSVLERDLCPGAEVQLADQVFNESRPTGTVVLASQYGCDSLVEVRLNYLETSEASLSGDTSVCAGNPVVLKLKLSTDAPFSYRISSGSGPISDYVESGSILIEQTPRSSDRFILEEVISTNGCPVTISDSVVFVTVSEPQIRLEPKFDYHGFGISCRGLSDGGVQAEVTQGLPPYTFDWSNGSRDTFLSDLAAGTYQLSITDRIGCKATAEIRLDAPPPLSAEAYGLVEGCNDTAISLIRFEAVSGGSGSYFYRLDSTAFVPLGPVPEEIGPLADNGTYLLEVKDENDCLLDLEVTVPAIENLSLELGPDQQLRLGDSLWLTPVLNFVPISWFWRPETGIADTAQFDISIKPLESTVYTLTATSPGGCTLSDEISIRVDARSPVYIPNAFSPNGDGVNDILMVYAQSGVAQIEALEIYDRWGNRLYRRTGFAASDPRFGWDGRAGNTIVSPATYIYRVQVRLISGEQVQIAGEINLIR